MKLDMIKIQAMKCRQEFTPKRMTRKDVEAIIATILLLVVLGLITFIQVTGRLPWQG